MKTRTPLSSQVLAFAGDLHHTSTDAEQRLWHLLRSRRLGGFKFRRQHPFPPYVLDFYNDARHRAIELDGGQHLDDVARDQRRSEFLREHGIDVLRFWNDAVFKETETVLETIWTALHEGLPSSDPSGHLLPQGEG
jgi:very-short-patch-repair endonuclease